MSDDSDNSNNNTDNSENDSSDDEPEVVDEHNPSINKVIDSISELKKMNLNCWSFPYWYDRNGELYCTENNFESNEILNLLIKLHDECNNFKRRYNVLDGFREKLIKICKKMKKRSYIDGITESLDKDGNIHITLTKECWDKVELKFAYLIKRDLFQIFSYSWFSSSKGNGEYFDIKIDLLDEDEMLELCENVLFGQDAKIVDKLKIGVKDLDG